MKHQPSIILLLSLAALSSGCVGTGPNTQRGAVGGAALGAIAGAIIGNNSGHGNAGRGALIGAAAGAIAGGTLGNAADHEQGTIYRSETSATSQAVVEEVPPPPLPETEVIVAQPVPEAIWVRGYWGWDASGRYVWVPGRWEVPPPGHYAYVPPHWKRHRHGYVYVRGYWH